MRYSLRLPVWASVPHSSATTEALKNRTAALGACNLPDTLPLTTDITADTMVKTHVDYLDENVHEEYREVM